MSKIKMQLYLHWISLYLISTEDGSILVQVLSDNGEGEGGQGTSIDNDFSQINEKGKDDKYC